MYVMKIESRA